MALSCSGKIMAVKEILRRARRTSGEGAPDRGEYREAGDTAEPLN
jgi:hypothetical protein